MCADVFDDLPASCCPAKYVDVCCPFAKPCNALAATPTPSMMTSSPTQRSGGKPFCMKPQNSSACEAGFFFNKSLKRLEPCPDGKFVVDRKVEMVSFELGEELRKMFFRLVTFQIRRFEFRFLMGTQNFFFVPRS